MTDKLHEIEDAYTRFREILRSDDVDEKHAALMYWYGAVGNPLGPGWKAAMIWAQYRTSTTPN